MDQVIRYIYQQVAEKQLNKNDAKTLLTEIQNAGKTDVLSEDIAVVGMACKFPGARDIGEYWNNILNAVNHVGPVPQGRLKDLEILAKMVYDEVDVSDVEDQLLEGGYLDEVDKFDAGFFKITLREAKYMDPLQRIFLETAWEAVEDAGYSGTIYGSQTGIYVGKDHSSKSAYPSLDTTNDPFMTTGTWTGILASRMAYIFNLTGPSVVVDTACSSGLVAVHMACKALQNGDCDMAIAGGIHLCYLPVKGGRLSMVEAEDSFVKTFDKHAGGTLWGEGCGAVFLKPLSKALADGDSIHAVIKGSAINNDGASNGITAPSAEAQEQLFVKAWEAARINPETIHFIEAHATGTVIGDPIEIKGLTNAFRHFTERKQFCAIGSVKSEIGHLVGAAGIAGFIKTILTLKSRMIPSNINFEDPNPFINFVDSPIYVAGKLTPWKAEEHPRRAGTSAFGFSGTNAHVVVEEAPTPEPTIPSGLPQLFTLSARSRETLEQLIQRYAQFFRSGADWNLDDLCFTAMVGRGHYSHRLTILARDKADFLAKFALLPEGAFTRLQADWFTYGEYRIISENKHHREEGDLTEGERKQRSRAANAGLDTLLAARSEGAEYEDALKALALHYTQGADLAWERLYAEQKRRRLWLPIYPLERIRCWLEPEIPTDKKKLGEINEVGHPLFDLCLAESMEQVIYSSEFTVEKHWVLSDHLVAGSHIIPGTTYLEMARLVAGRLYPGLPVGLRDVLFLMPLEVARGEKKTVHTIVKMAGDHLEFTIASKAGLADWHRHAEGKIYPLENRPHAVVDLKALYERCAAKATRTAPAKPQDTGETGGEKAANPGKSIFGFGPRWRNNLQVLQSGDEILVELTAAEIAAADLAEYGLHPGLLDNAVNVASQSTGEGPYLPLIYKSFQIFGAMPPKFYTYLKRKTDLSGNLETVTFDITLCDENGEVFAYAEDYSLKRFRVNEWKAKSQAASRHYYEIGWLPAAPPAAEGSLHAKMLLIKDTLGIADGLRKKLEAAGVSLVEAEFGDTYRKNSDTHYTIKGDADDYAQLFSDLKGQGVGAILHLGAITGAVNDLTGLQAAENRGIYSIFRLAKAYFANKFSDRVELVLITDCAHPVRQESEIHPHQSTLAAIGKTVNAENANLICRAIDLDPETDAQLILQELITPAAPYLVAYRRGVRFIEEFRRLEIEVNEERAVKVKEGGVYLITGGTGGLGLEFAKHFAGQPHVKLALTNRSALPERSRWGAVLEQEPKSKLGRRIAAIQELEGLGAEVNCFAVNVADIKGMKDMVDSLRTQYGRIDGIVHAAGVAGDGFLMRKSEETFAGVLRPKIDGTWILHELTREDHLDFFVLFSSINSILAGAGQGDYAAANAYLDSFAAYRNARGERTIAINWPAWKETGMAVDFGIRDDRTSFKGITTARGLTVFDELLGSEVVRTIPAELNMEILAGLEKPFPVRLSAPLKAIVDRSRAAAGAGGKDPKVKKQLSNVVVKGAESIDEIEMKLARIWGNVLELPEVDIYDNFYDMGGDSLLATKLAKEIKEEYPNIDISDIFTYPTVAQLSQYIKDKMGDAETQMLEVAATVEGPAAAQDGSVVSVSDPHEAIRFASAARAGEVFHREAVDADFAGPLSVMPANEKTSVLPVGTADSDDRIAIIGMACKLPGANDPDQFWANLQAGLSSITDFIGDRKKDIDILIPEEVRSRARYFKGGYLDEVDKFDAGFFNISPREAALIEPIQRLFLQVAMEALEDSGYGGQRLYGSKTGVFVGRDHTNESYYKKMIGENDPLVKIGSWTGLLSSRLSYFMNFRGPSLVIDTACSSGLVSVHQACMSLRAGECNTAIAGGVNLFSMPLVSPEMAGLESPDGVLRAFDAAANGTVWGEGIVAVVLKPLRQAMADGDQIHAVIKGSAINNDGASNGITAPSALAQEEVIVEALKQAKVHPETIGYIEAHGTATSIGDPIEIKGITNAYRHFTDQRRFCAIGSVKSGIGHTVGASGIASLVKVVMALKHHGIPASLNYTVPNPHINFDESPVYVNTEYREWPAVSGPRRAAVSSFGFSGTNAHMIVEEAPAQPVSDEEVTSPVMVTLSARSQEALRHLIQRYRTALDGKAELNLNDLAFTANTGRGHYGCRLAVIVNSYADFQETVMRLAGMEDLARVQENGVYYGEHKIVISQNKTGARGTLTEGERRELSRTATSLAEVLRHARGRAAEPVLAGLCDLYIQGATIDWNALYAGQARRRIGLPVYPFERKRIWVDVDPRRFSGNGPGAGNGGTSPSADGGGAPQSGTVPVHADPAANPEFCQVRWIPGGSVERAAEPGNILIFADETGLSGELRSHYETAARTVFEVRYGDAYAQTDSTRFTITGSEDDYIRLLTELKDQRLTHIFHLATITGDEEVRDLDRMAAMQRRGLYSIYFLSKAVLKVKYKNELQLLLISQYGYAVTGDEARVRPEQAAFYGIGKGLSLELPFIKCRAIDLDEGTTAGELITEMEMQEPVYNVALRGGRKYIQELVPLSAEELDRREISLSSDGVYLITGGTGGIGMEYAKYLAKQQSVRIALTSRSGLPAREEWETILRNPADRRGETLRMIREIEDAGSVVRWYCADVADQAQMQTVIQEIRKEFGRINGVFHAAGLLLSGVLATKPVEDFDRVVRTKLQGTWVLDQLTREDRPDFFIICSSIAAYLNAVGLGDYTAANLYLNSYAEERTREGLPTLALCWPHWLETGLALNMDLDHRNLVFESLRTADGHAYFAALTGCGLPHVIPARLNPRWIHRFERAFTIRLAPAFEALTAEVEAEEEVAGTAVAEVARRSFSAEETMRLMQTIWKEVFGYEAISPDADFFEIGGNSLIAMNLINRIYQTFGVPVALEDFLRYATVQELAAYLSEQTPVEEIVTEILPVADQPYYPVSSSQKRILVINHLEQNSTSYNMPSISRLDGNLDFTRFEAAFAAIVQRHESLRTSFDIIDGEPVQIVHERVDFKVSYHEASEAEATEIAKAFIRPFNLKHAPLMRVGLVKYGEGRHLLLFDMHHIISDGTSLGIISKEFHELYNGRELAPLPLRYRDYAVWQNRLFASDAIGEQEAYWLNNLSGQLPILALPTDHPRPAYMSFTGQTLRFAIDRDLTGKVNQLAREYGATQYMVLLTAYTILLAKYSGQEDIIVGTPVAGRNHADLDKIVGMFINSLVMRNFPLPAKSVSAFLKEVKETAFAAFNHQDYPFEMIVDKLRLPRDLSRNPIFDTMFALHNFYLPHTGESGLVTGGSQEFENTAIQFDLQLQAYEVGDHYRCTLEFSTALFKRESMERFITHYLNIVRAMVEDPEIPISEIAMITPEEREYLIYGLNQTEADFSRDKSIYRLFEEHAAARPDRTALVFGGESVSYHELNQSANRLAHLLRKYGAAADQLVGVLMDRSPRMAESILAAWKAGAGYIPLDCEYPVQRLAGILHDSEAKILVTFSAHCPAELRDAFRGQIILLDTDAAEIEKEPDHNPELPMEMDSLAYVIYTSGSTGKPKGAMVEHIGMMNHIQAKVHDLNLTAESIVAQNSSHCFDISVWQFFVALTLGGTTAIYPQEVTLDPKEFIGQIIDQKVTILEVVPSYLSVMLDYLEGEKRPLERLKSLLVTGEIVKPNLVKRWFALYPVIPMVNAYGPTEASDDITHFIMTEAPEGESIPIGRPVQNFHIYIVDQNMHLCPVGVKGEICVSGVGVGRGYLHNPEKTREAFTVDPFVAEPDVRMYRTGDLGRWLPDGTIEFFGRKDYQVKIRGFRIELGEIETKLVGHPEIKESVVVDREDQNGNKYLSAYITVKAEVDLNELKTWLLESLPEYMVPAYFVILPQLPLNPNGKIDRKALPEPESQAIAGTEYVAPRNEEEERLAKIWAEVLGIEKVGVNDNFFEIGGNSIKLITLAYKINQEFGGELESEMKVIELFRLTTIAQLADHFGRSRTREIQEYTL